MENKDITNYSREETLAALQKLVGDWLNGGINRNASVLARGAGVSEACIRRILNNNSMPQIENVRKIVSFIGAKDSNEKLFKSIPSEITKHLVFELSHLGFKELNDYRSIDAFEKFLPDFSHLVIFERSSMGNGISKDEISKMFGQNGSQISNNLISSGLVEEIDNMLVAKPAFRNHCFSQAIYKHYVGDLIRNFYKDNSQINYIFSVTEGVSAEGYSKVMNIIEQSHKAILQVVQASPGNIPLATGGFMDTMTYDSLFDKTGDEK